MRTSRIKGQRKKPAKAGNDARPGEHEPARRQIQAEFIARMRGGRQFWALFEFLPEVDFFAKDADGRFVAGNSGLIRRLGLRSEQELLGLTDADIHPERDAREIREDDARVMSTRKPLVDRVEALFTRRHAKDWYVTTKVPIVSAEGEVIGVMGFVRPYRHGDKSTPGAERLERVVEYIHANHAKAISVEALARIACFSVRQLHRQFQSVFGMSTQTFIARTRVQAASDDLVLTEKPLSEIALDHGFCDQSAFSRRFTQHTGETPLRFRQRHHGGARNVVGG